MSSKFFNPDVKINMSLDQIIQVTRSELLSQLRGRFLRDVKKKKRPKRKGKQQTSEHPVPFMSSLRAGHIYVKSPLFRAKNKGRMAMAVSNRTFNSGSIEKTKEIIPACYKLYKTATGVERVLVPVEECIINIKRKKITPHVQFLKSTTIKNLPVSPQTKQPLPLTVTPTFKMSENHSVNNKFIKMEVDESDDEVSILDCFNRIQNETLIINVRFNSQALNIKDKAHLAEPQKPITNTLNDRFTLLSYGIDL